MGRRRRESRGTGESDGKEDKAANKTIPAEAGTPKQETNTQAAEESGEGLLESQNKSLLAEASGLRVF